MIPSYMITCRGCEDRANATLPLLDQHIPTEKWVGLHGRTAGIATTNPYTVDDPSGKYHIPAGHVSLVLNHWFLWQEMLRRGVDKVLVWEDDAVPVDDFAAKAEEVLKDPAKWDFLYVGHLSDDQRFVRPDALISPAKADPYGTHCYIATRKGLQVLVEKCERVYANIDLAIWQQAIPHMRHGCVVKPLAHQRRDNSTFNNTLG